ncbi:MAG: DUF1249 domain-containing protein [Gammaproteobacteria bacterium]
MQGPLWKPLDIVFHRRRYANLMEVYERNYELLESLLPFLDHLPDRARSCAAGAAPLHLEVLERHRYTTELHLTHRFDDDNGETTPDITLRVYHDSRQAEFMDANWAAPAGAEDGPIPGHELEWKWAANLFLERWLVWCLNEGHDFPGAGGRTPGRRQSAVA